MTSPSFSTRGVIDLGALRSAPPQRTGQLGGGSAPAARPGGSAGAGAGEELVFDVTEADFQSAILDRSMTVPVVIDFWATWCGPCKTLSPILEQLAAADAGRWVLAKVDVDANQRLAAAFQVQSIPTVFAVIKGQPVPLFQGTLPQTQVRQYLDEVLRIADANGVTGAGDPAADGPVDVDDRDLTGADGAYPAADGGDAEMVPPGIAAGLDAVERGDLDAAAAAYQGVLAEAPGDPMARAGLAQVQLLRRAEGLDLRAARARAAATPDDVAAQCDAADAALLEGAAEEAFAILVETVRRTAGPDRDLARERLLELFEVVGSDDPGVIKARTALANALF